VVALVVLCFCHGGRRTGVRTRPKKEGAASKMCVCFLVLVSKNRNRKRTNMFLGCTHRAMNFGLDVTLFGRVSALRDLPLCAGSIRVSNHSMDMLI